MSVKVTVRQLQEQLTNLLDRTVKDGEECIVQRNGEDYAVIISANKWRRIIGEKLDALGPDFRLAKQRQVRAEELLAKNKEGCLTRAERRELDALLRECDDVMLRRAEAMDSLA